MNGEEKKAKASKDPIPNPQYICQYKIQNIVPNTFSNKESIAHKESLHNQLKKFIPYPSTVDRGGGLLITSPHYCVCVWKRSSILTRLGWLPPENLKKPSMTLHGVTRLQICPRKTSSETSRHRWYYYGSKYWFPGFGFDSGPNLQP